MIDAVVDLLEEGHAPPSTAEMTARAGVSEATLFRYFETIDELQMEATARFLDKHAPLFTLPGGGARLDARIDRFVAARFTLWDTIAPVVRLGRARAFDNPTIAELLRANRRSQAAQIEEHFRVDLAGLPSARRDDAVSLLATLTSFESWDAHRNDFDRTPTQVRRAWKLAVRSLLHPSNPGPSRSRGK